MKRTWIFIFTLTLITIGLGTLRLYVLPVHFPQLLKQLETKQDVVSAPTPTPQAEAELAARLAAEARISSASAAFLQKLTPRQKVAQLVAFPVPVTSSNSAEREVEGLTEVPGVFTLTGRQVAALQAEQAIALLDSAPRFGRIQSALPELTNEERALLKPLIAVDHEGGTVQRISGEGMTVIPSAQEQCALTKEELNALVLRSARELQSIGVDIIFAPVVDLAENHPVLKTRVCSPNPEVVRIFAEQWIVALQSHNITPVIKHYPGIGQTTTDLHKNPDRIEFNPVEHSVFVSLLSKFPKIGVMSSHVVIGDAQVSQDIVFTQNLPCTVSTECMSLLPESTDQLRFTDALEMASAQGFEQFNNGEEVTLDQLSIAAINAGHTTLVFDASISAAKTNELISRLSDEYQRSPEFRQNVDRAVMKLWRKKMTQ